MFLRSRHLSCRRRRRSRSVTGPNTEWIAERGPSARLVARARIRMADVRSSASQRPSDQDSPSPALPPSSTRAHARPSITSMRACNRSGSRIGTGRRVPDRTVRPRNTRVRSSSTTPTTSRVRTTRQSVWTRELHVRRNLGDMSFGSGRFREREVSGRRGIGRERFRACRDGGRTELA